MWHEPSSEDVEGPLPDLAAAGPPLPLLTCPHAAATQGETLKPVAETCSLQETSCMSQGPHGPVTTLWSHFRQPGQHPQGPYSPSWSGTVRLAGHTRCCSSCGVFPSWARLMPRHPRGRVPHAVHLHHAPRLGWQPGASSLTCLLRGLGAELQTGPALAVLCSTRGQSPWPWVCLWDLYLICTRGDRGSRGLWLICGLMPQVLKA